MRSLLAFAISWLPLLSLTSISVWVIFGGVRESMREKSATKKLAWEPLRTPLHINMPIVQQRGKRSIYIATITALILGVGIGYASREFQTYRNTQTMGDVLVLNRFDPQNYRLQTEWGQSFGAVICPNSSADWEPGEKLQIWIYEQKHGCKSMNGPNLGYIKYSDGNGQSVKFPIPPKEIADAR
jgi:hypothetical protein